MCTLIITKKEIDNTNIRRNIPGATMPREYYHAKPTMDRTLV